MGGLLPSNASRVAWLTLPRSATTVISRKPKRRRMRSMTGTRVVTSAVLPGHNSQQIGLPWTSMARPTTLWLEVGPMIFAMAAFAQALSALAFKVKGGGVEKDQLHFGKQV